MPARFRLFDSGPDKGADRFFIVDSRPYSPNYPRGPWRMAISFNREPYHPQGIGMTVELDAAAWGNALTHYFRNWGRRIKLEDLIELDSPSGAYLVIDFVGDMLDEESPEHRAISEFLAGRAIYDPDIVHQVRSNPKVARILRQLLREESAA